MVQDTLQENTRVKEVVKYSSNKLTQVGNFLLLTVDDTQ